MSLTGKAFQDVVANGYGLSCATSQYDYVASANLFAVTDDGDFFQQPLVRGALAHQRGRTTFGGQRTVAVGALAFVFHTQRQPLKALHHADGGGGQAGKGLQVAEVHH